MQHFALRRRRAIRLNVEDLIEPEAGKQFAAALAAMNHVKMPVAEFLQAQSHARHCPHEGGIHHDAILQVDDEFAIAAVHHLPGKFLEVAAVQEAAFALHPHPDGWAVYSDLNRRLHN